MEEATVYIGYKTANGHKIKEPRMIRTNKYQGDPLKKPWGLVTLYVDGLNMFDVELKPLIRFSRTVATAFPKRNPTKETKEAKDGVETKAGAEAKDEAGPKDEAETKAGAQAKAKAGAEEGKKGASTAAKSREQAAPRFAVEVFVDEQSKKRVVNITGVGREFWTVPDQHSFDVVYQWMLQAQRTPNGVKYADLKLSDEGHNKGYTMRDLVDVHAAADVLGLHPRPAVLRQQMLDHISNHSPQAEDIQYLHEHLPVQDSAITRMINTYFLRGGQKLGYTEETFDAFGNYIDECGDRNLVKRYNALVAARRRARKHERKAEVERRQQQKMQGQQKPAPTPVTGTKASTTTRKP